MAGLEESELSAIFDKAIRPFLDAIDNLRKFGLDEDLKLPTVVVIGDQSSGKSSILEAISGIQLPRGTGMVTKCPLQLQMKQTKSKHWSAILTYNDNDGTVVERVMQDPSEVEDAIKEAQKKILGDTNGISETLLTLRVENVHVPDLTLVDLPGIARVSVGDQAENLPEQIINLLRKYISREETIILCVSPCNVDLATTESLKMAQEYDTECSRTFGVLTKADLVDHGSEVEILKILNNEVLPLEKGYTIVKCRSQKALMEKESLKTSLKKEQEFFKNHKIFGTLDKSQWGIKSLSTKLAKELFEIITNELPNIRKAIMEKEKILSDQLNYYEISYPTAPEHRLMFALKVTNDFLLTLHELTEGKYYSPELGEIESSMPPNSPNMRLIPFARRQFDILYDGLVEVTQGVQLEETLEKLIKIGQGKEPRDFLSYDTFKQVACIFVNNAKPSVLSCMEEVAKNFERVLQYLMNHYFKKYSSFLTNISIVVRDIFRKAKEHCLKDLQLLLEKEMTFFTMDRLYEEKIKSLEALQDVKYSLNLNWLRYFAKPTIGQEKTNGTITGTTIPVKSGLGSNGNEWVFHIPQTSRTGTSPSNVIPGTFSHHQLANIIRVDHGLIGGALSNRPSKLTTQQMPKYVIVYYLLAISRISDHVSVSILHWLMNKFDSTLRTELPCHVAQPEIYDLLQNAAVGVKEKKDILKYKLKGLKRGIEEIDNSLLNISTPSKPKRIRMAEKNE